MVGREHGRNNQAGDLVPQTSPWGQALAAAQGRLLDQPAPIGTRFRRFFGGTVGGVVTMAAHVNALNAPGGYGGDVPQSQQGYVFAAPPWERA